MQRPGNKNKFGMFTRNSRVRAAVMRWTGRKQVTSGPVDHGKEFGFFFLMKLLKICYTRYYLQGIQTLTEETDIQRNNDKLIR